MKKRRLLYVMLFVFAVFLSNRMFLGTAEAAWQAERIGAGTTISYPRAIAIKGDNLYIADWSGKKIIIMSKSGSLIKTVDMTLINSNFRPAGIACDANYTYVTDDYNSRLYKFDIENDAYQVILDEYDSVNGWSMSGPKGIAIDGGDIYIADLYHNRILQTDTDGSSLSVVMDSTYLSTPSDVAVYDGYIYVADSGNKRIVKMKTDGTDFQVVASGFVTLSNIEIVNGRLYATDAQSNSIYIDGNFYDAKMGQYDYGLGIAVDNDGSIYVGTSGPKIYHVGYQNLAPTASSVTISGTLTIGQQLTGSYTYSDTEGDLEGGSTYQWYRSDAYNGSNKTPISGQTGINYTLTAADVNKYISFEVTPVSSAGASPGTKDESFYYGPIGKLTQEAISYSDTTKTYGDAAFSYTASGGSGSGTFSYTSSNTAVASIDSSSGLVTIHKAGSVTLTASKGYDATYYTAFKNCTLTINKKELTSSVTANAKTYDGTGAGAGSIDLTGKVGSDTVNASGTFTFASAAVGTGKTVNVTGITLTGTDKDNYSISSTASTTADINKAVLTATVGDYSKTYGATNPSFTVDVTGFVNGESAGTASGYSAPTASTTATTATKPSAVAITISGGVANNYSFITTDTGTLTIGKKELTATASASAKTYDGGTTSTGSIALTGKVGSDTVNASGTFTFDSAAAGTGKTVNVTGITLTGTDKDNYTVAATAGTTANITAKALTATATADTKTYDGTSAGTGSISLTGKVGSDAVSASGTFTFASAAAGTGRSVSVTGITLTGTDKDNYTVSTTASTTADINKAVLTATVGDYNKTYGASNPSFTVGVTGFVNGENAGTAAGYSAPVAATTATTTSKPANVTITISGGAATNYSFITTDTGILTIEKKELTATATANAKTYDGGTTGSGSIALTGKVGSDAVGASGTFTFISATAGTNKNVNVTGITLTGVDKDNYTVAATTGTTANITAKTLTATATANPKTYDGTSAGTGSIDLAGKVGSDEVGASGTFTFASATVGTGKNVNVTGITLSGADKDNYTVSTTAATTGIISKAVLTATVGDYSKTYGATNPSFTVGVTGFVNGENAGTAAGYSVPTATTTATTATKPSDVAITISGGVATNYSFNTTDTGILTIEKKALTATTTANAKTYDGGTTGSGSIALTGKVGSDTVGASGTFTFDSAAAGTGKTVNITGIALTGADKDNYTVSTTAATTGIINKAVLTATVEDYSKTYGATNPSFTVDLTGFVNGENAGTAAGFSAPVAATTATTTSKPANIAITISGGAATNYSFNTTDTGILTIEKKALTATASANAKTYDGGTTGSGSIALTGKVGSDEVSASGSFTFASAAAGTGKTVSVTGIVLSGADKNNYIVSTAPSTTADINKAVLTATVGDYSKIYGATNPSFTVGVAGFVNGENAGTAAGYSSPTVSTTATTATKPSDVAITISGGAATNYSFITTDTGILTIEKKELTVTATANDKAYDGGTTGSGSIALTGIVGSDTVGASGTFTFASATAGTGKIVNVTGIALSGVDKDNYTVSTTVATAGIINKAVLTATIGDYSKTYGAANPSFTVGVTGFVNGENAGTAAGYSAPAAVTTATTASKPANVAITISGGAATNYSFNTTDTGILTIEKKELTAIVTANAKTYDGGTTGSGSIALTGKVGSDTVGASGTFTFESSAAGTGKTVSITGIALTGADKDNYTLSTPTSTTGDINKAVLTATVGDYSKTYGATNPSFTVDVTGFVNGENAGTAAGYSTPVAATTATTASKPANIAITISGGAATNYSFNTTDTGILTIVKKALTATATANSKTYDGNTAVSGSIALTGKVGSDSVSASGTFTFASATVGTGKSVNVTGITLTGADKDNYSVNLTTTTTGTISEDTRTITGYFKDSTGDDKALTTTASVAYGTEGTTALAKLSSSGYAKLSDGSYVAVHINWTFDSTYNKNNSGDKSVTGTVSGTFIGGQIPVNITGTVTVGEMISTPVNNTPTGDSGSKPAKTEGTIEKDQKRDEGAPAATINNSSEDLKAKVLDSSERGKVAAGEDAKVILKIEDISTSVSEENKKLIEEKIKQELPGSGQQNLETTLLFVDISLFKKIGNGEETKVTEIRDKISISIEIPKELWNADDNYNRTYKVVRIHDGVAEILEGTYDSEKHLFTFETDRFSTYALTYQDTTKGTGEDTAKTEIVVSNDFYQLHLTAEAASTTQTLSYARLSGVNGYHIYGAKCGKKMVELADVAGGVTSYTVKDLKQATYYKFQVIAYKIIDGKKVNVASSKLIYSITTSKTYGNPVKVTSKISARKLAVGATDTLTCKVVLSNGKKLKKYASTIRYESTNKKIAIVNSDGKISAKSKGICYIYAYAQNGIYKKIKITVE